MSCPEIELSEHALRAFSLMATVLGVLQPFGNLRQDRVVAAAVDRSRTLARREYQHRSAQGTPLRNFLACSLAEVVREMEAAAAGAADPDEVRATSLARALLDEVRDGGELPHVLAASFEDCLATARKFYEDRLTFLPKFPTAVLQLSDSPDINEALPGRRLGFSGFVTFGDRRSEKKSEVRLRVTPAEVDFGCMATLPYVLMHELLCHWPQMAASVNCRSNPDMENDRFNPGGLRIKVDAVAEAWIDRYVAGAIGLTSSGPADAVTKAAAIAQAIHHDRVDALRNPVYADAARISVGEDAAVCVETLYVREGDGDVVAAIGDAERLGCELNVADWSYGQRTRGCQRIAIACRTHFGQGEHAPDTPSSPVVAALLGFRQNSCVEPVIEAVTKR